MIPQKLHSCNFRQNAGVILMHRKLPKQAINETCCASLTLSAFSLDIGLVESVATIWSIMPKCSFIRRGGNRVARRTRNMKLGRYFVEKLCPSLHTILPQATSLHTRSVLRQCQNRFQYIKVQNMLAICVQWCDIESQWEVHVDVCTRKIFGDCLMNFSEL